MSYRLKTALVAVATLLGLPAIGSTEIITFENLNIPVLIEAGPQTEGPFTYEAVIGNGWQIQTTFGNSPSALATFFDNGNNNFDGDTVNITLTDGGIFTFNSVDTSTILSANSDQVTITGFLGMSAVGSLLLNTSTPTPTGFLTVASPFSGPIDLLQVVVGGTTASDNARLLDNFNVTVVPEVVPEPLSLALVLAGLGGLGMVGLIQRSRRAG